MGPGWIGLGDLVMLGSSLRRQPGNAENFVLECLQEPLARDLELFDFKL